MCNEPKVEVFVGFGVDPITQLVYAIGVVHRYGKEMTKLLDEIDEKEKQDV